MIRRLSTHLQNVPSHRPVSERNLALLLNSISKRRVENSPTLPLEAVALPLPVRERIREYIARQNLSARQLRLKAKSMLLVRAHESLNQKVVRKRGMPIVQPPPTYDPSVAAAFAAVRMPATFTANVFVMAEAARLLPHLVPNSILDFGSGPATSLISASRVFSQSQAEPLSEDSEEKLSTIRKASLVDSSFHMRSLAAEIASVDPWIDANMTVSHLSTLQECKPQETFDIVSSSYSLNEIVRDAMASPPKDSLSEDQRSIGREHRLQLAEKRLRRTAKALWSRTAPNGLFIIIEDGTAAGFETVAFVRDAILKTSPPASIVEDASSQANMKGEESTREEVVSVPRPVARAHVVAPCLHSRACPLNGSITRHRVCRFQQRLNRPQFTRSALPMPTGYEDEYFSFLVVQKLVAEEQEITNNVNVKNPRWGRLIRQPLHKGKHVTLDACTNEAKLERRVISKKNAPEGMYSRARRAKWGDVWSSTPPTAPQQLNF